ncbi:recombinase family protein, partial [Priestia megaterium]|nr:recombinase family protein [Priestia megaterium]
MENRKFGYIRVSSRDQNEGRQLQLVQEVGISP